MSESIFFSRNESVAEQVERKMRECAESFDAALYRLNNPRLAEALAGLHKRGVRVRLVVDAGKYREDSETSRLLAESRVPFRLAHGRTEPGPGAVSTSVSKMHHKFVILDGRTVLTGSYNWTTESEEQNYENLVGLSQPEQVRAFQEEFEELWRRAESRKQAG